jgi:hypothetical protein
MGYHYAGERPRLSKFEPPIKAWYSTGTRDYNGQLWVDSTWPSPETLDDIPVMPSDDSRLRNGVSSEFTNVLVIADINMVAGYEIGPISDYMAMLVLAQPHSLTSCDPLPSILDLMASNCSDQDKPKALTPADLAYLEALYAVSGDQSIYVGRDEISNIMQHELTAPH